jgi:hypothetical protein
MRVAATLLAGGACQRLVGGCPPFPHTPHPAAPPPPPWRPVDPAGARPRPPPVGCRGHRPPPPRGCPPCGNLSQGQPFYTTTAKIQAGQAFPAVWSDPTMKRGSSSEQLPPPHNYLASLRATKPESPFQFHARTAKRHRQTAARANVVSRFSTGRPPPASRGPGAASPMTCMTRVSADPLALLLHTRSRLLSVDVVVGARRRGPLQPGARPRARASVTLQEARRTAGAGRGRRPPATAPTPPW